MGGEELDIALNAAGMITVSEILNPRPFDKVYAHASVNDMESFWAWLNMERRSYCEMKARHDLGIHVLSPDVEDFVLGKLAILHEVVVNLRNSTNEP